MNVVLNDGYTKRRAWVRNHFVKYDAISIDSILGSVLKLRKRQQFGYEEWLNKERSTK